MSTLHGLGEGARCWHIFQLQAKSSGNSALPFDILDLVGNLLELGFRLHDVCARVHLVESVGDALEEQAHLGLLLSHDAWSSGAKNAAGQLPLWFTSWFTHRIGHLCCD